VVNICSRVGGFFELSVSKDDDLTDDFTAPSSRKVV
jgi:hypothetical protein